jgi:hypothetical protein
MSLTTFELAKTLEQLEESPEKVMFGRLLNELGSQSEERVRSAAKQVSLDKLKDLVYQFQIVIEQRKGESVEMLKQRMVDEGISAEELRAFMNK